MFGGQQVGHFVSFENYKKKMEETFNSLDGNHFLGKLNDATARLTDLCTEYDPDKLGLNAALSEEGSNSFSLIEIVVEGLLRTSIGKAQLLMQKRFPQFKELCALNLDPEADKRPRNTDLEGYWELIMCEFYSSLSTIT